jgi:hypothetical protein
MMKNRIKFFKSIINIYKVYIIMEHYKKEVSNIKNINKYIKITIIKYKMINKVPIMIKKVNKYYFKFKYF